MDPDPELRLRGPQSYEGVPLLPQKLRARIGQRKVFSSLEIRSVGKDSDFLVNGIGSSAG